MKKIAKIIVGALVLSLCLAIAACGGKKPVDSSPVGSDSESQSESVSESDSSGGSYVSAVELRFYNSEITMEVYRTLELRYQLTGTQEQPVFVSSAPEIVSVNERGEIRTLKAGTAVITASVGDVESSCTVIVTEMTDYPVLLLSRTEAELLEGRSVRVVPEISFRLESVEANEIRFVSADSSVATVDENGLITGVSAGATTVFVTAEWQGIVLTEQVSVTVKTSQTA